LVAIAIVLISTVLVNVRMTHIESRLTALESHAGTHVHPLPDGIALRGAVGGPVPVERIRASRGPPAVAAATGALGDAIAERINREPPVPQAPVPAARATGALGDAPAKTLVLAETAKTYMRIDFRLFVDTMRLVAKYRGDCAVFTVRRPRGKHPSTRVEE
jgi:hypothetical protein